MNKQVNPAAKSAATRAKSGRKAYAVAWIYGRGWTDTSGKPVVRVVRGTKAAVTAWLESPQAPAYTSEAGYREAATVAELRAMGRDPAKVEHWAYINDCGVEDAL